MVVQHRPARRLFAVFALLFFAATLGSGLLGIVEGTRMKINGDGDHWEQRSTVVVVIRRRLIGSTPPSCRARCGRCFPCRPVQVAIQPGRSVPLEYYPEAWRCKCHNMLFMP